MTRARDELILSHAADYGGARARRVSPFVLEALDLPAAAGRARAPARAASRRRWSGWRRSTAAAAPARAPLRGPIDEPLSLSFYQVDDYLTCPLKYKYAPRPARPAGAAPRDRSTARRSTRRSSCSTTATPAATS